DLNGRVAGLGGEEGFRGDAFERREGSCESDAGVVEVERCEFVEGAFPLAVGLKLDAVQVTWDGPASGFEQFVDCGGPVSVRAFDGAEVSPVEERQEGAKMVEQNRQPGALLRLRGEPVQ